MNENARVREMLKSPVFTGQYSFDTFDRDMDPKAFDKAVDFAENQTYTGQHLSGLYMFGQTGVGKTHLSVSMIRVLADRYREGVPVRYGLANQPEGLDEMVNFKPFTTSCLSMPEFWSKIKAAKSFNAEHSQEQIIDVVARTHCVLFDDIDRGLHSYEQLDILFRLFSLRLAMKTITVITANRPFVDYENMLYEINPQYADPIVSRIKGCVTGQIAFANRSDHRGVPCGK